MGVVLDDMVKVIFIGDKKMKDIMINFDVVDFDDVDMLQDLVVVVVNDVLIKVDEQI